MRTTNTLAPSFDNAAAFADPFADLASVAMPISVPAMLRHAEFFAVTNETLREAFNRIAAYFLTDLDIQGDTLGQDEIADQRQYLLHTADIDAFQLESGLSLLTYGNQYTSVMLPFTRYLSCPKSSCRTQFAFEEFSTRPEYKFRWQNGFHGRCSSCGYDGDFGNPIDVGDEAAPIILKSWNPHDIRPIFNESTGRTCAYDWVIPADFRSEVRMGYNRFVLGSTPWEFLKAALNDENVRMTPEFVHHWREPALAGLRFRGIGVPRAIINYRQLYYTQIVRRMNEVLALGHIVPLRVVSPANTSGRDADAGDILRTQYLGDLRSRVMQMWANHRADPTSIHVSPIPLQLQSLGADARQLIPADIMNQGQEVLLNGSGVPVEFYRMSMQTQNAPVGLRLIDRVWAPFVSGLNRQLQFIANRLQTLLRWSKSRVTRSSVRLVDAIELNQLRVQMAQASLLSRTTALKTVDADFAAETRQKLEDQRIEQIAQAKFQKEMDAYAFADQLGEAQPGMMPQQPQPGQPGADGQMVQAGGGGAAGPQMAGTPAGSDPLAGILPQPGQKIDPQDLYGRAQAAAQTMIQMPDSDRFSKLQEIRKSNPVFHAMVKGQLDEIRSSARSQGQKLMLQQQGAPQ